MSTKQTECGWIFDEVDDCWNTDCDNKFCFTEDGIKENKFKFCPYCGGVIVEEVIDHDA